MKIDLNAWVAAVDTTAGEFPPESGITIEVLQRLCLAYYEAAKQPASEQPLLNEFQKWFSDKYGWVPCIGADGEYLSRQARDEYVAWINKENEQPDELPSLEQAWTKHLDWYAEAKGFITAPPSPKELFVAGWKAAACALDQQDDIALLIKTVADWEYASANNDRLVRELDVALNGEDGAAKQASLCDIVSQVKAMKRESVTPEKAIELLVKIVRDGTFTGELTQYRLGYNDAGSDIFRSFKAAITAEQGRRGRDD